MGGSKIWQGRTNRQNTGTATFSYKMSTSDRNTDVTEWASTSKEKADKIADKRGKTNSVVWKWFGFLRSDKLQLSVLCKMSRRAVPTSSGNRGEMRLKRRHANSCCLRHLLAYHDNRLCARVERASCVSCLQQIKILCIWSGLPHECEVSLSQTHLSLSTSALFREWLKQAALSVKTQICCFSNFTCKYSRNHSTFAFILFDFIRRRHDYKSGFLCRLTSWKGELFVLMGSHFSHYTVFMIYIQLKQFVCWFNL